MKYSESHLKMGFRLVTNEITSDGTIGASVKPLTTLFTILRIFQSIF